MKPTCQTFDKSWRHMCHLFPVERSQVSAMIRQHYLGRWPGVCVLTLAAAKINKPFGVIVFALPPRESHKRYGGITWELARLWIDDKIPQNAETWCIGKAIKYIREHHPEVSTIVSYADPSVGHSGVIYRAANFKSDGRTDDDRKSPRSDYADVVTGKRYSRRKHIPAGIEIKRIPRVSKFRYVYRITPFKE